jgi:5-methylcytosine-specific restriction enzyme B
MQAAYGDWLRANFQPATVNTQLAQARRLEGAYGDLDEGYDRDKFKNILTDLAFSTEDRDSGKANRSRIKINGEKVYEGLAHLRAALGYYVRFRSARDRNEERSARDWPELYAMRSTFLKRCSDFVNFEIEAGKYFENERSYKNKLIANTTAILGSHDQSPESLGIRVLTLLQSKPANFVGWRAFAELNSHGEEVRRAVALAIGKLVLSNDEPPGAVAAAAEQISPFVRTERGTPDFSALRSLVSAALALARPHDAICIKTTFMQRAAQALLGKKIFKAGVLTAGEYTEFLELSQRIMTEFANWGWEPRDFWDVQGFLWVVTTSNGEEEGESPEEEPEQESTRLAMASEHPLNCILYGPPGTGKTWVTAQMAVEICTGSVPKDRCELMKMYNDLVRTRRVAFTTFHQSIGYEEFVEGLRPVTENDGESDGPGVRLEARNGIFRDICALAEQARKRVGRPRGFDFDGRRFFKMSLGRARTESHIYDAAIAGRYIVLGWGGDVDWSDQKYNDYQAIFDRWQKVEPGASGNSGNISQLWTFRSSMKKGDIIIVSDGNLRFRAIGEVTGDYEFKPSEDGNHRRSVKWLAVLEESLPIETVHNGKLSQASCYQLTSSRMKLDVLAEQITTDMIPTTSTPEAFVLIIDEINRANVSKVLGELITLLEPDKRLGEQNALTVRLPYSGDDFGVPNNLYVIGTMNTADRSIALLDTALRRRFEFKEMMPEYGLIDREVDGINLRQLLFAINQRIEWLFDRDHQLGHSFFVQITKKPALDETMRSKVIPLLAEYFYEDWEKVRAALNDTGNWFIEVEKLLPPILMNGPEDPRSRYAIKPGEIPLDAYLSASGKL